MRSIITIVQYHTYIYPRKKKKKVRWIVSRESDLFM